MRCKNDGRGHCSIHRCIMKKLYVTTRKWGDRGQGRDFGWVKSKVIKYSCDAKITDQMSLANYPDSHVMSDGYEQTSNLGISQDRHVGHSS